MQASATFPGRECWRTRPQDPGTILFDRIAEGLGRNTESPRRRAPKRLKSSTREERVLQDRTPQGPSRLSREAPQILVSSSTSANLPKQKPPVREPNRPNTPAGKENGKLARFYPSHRSSCLRSLAATQFFTSPKDLSSSRMASSTSALVVFNIGASRRTLP